MSNVVLRYRGRALMITTPTGVEFPGDPYRGDVPWTQRLYDKFIDKSDVRYFRTPDWVWIASRRNINFLGKWYGY